MGGDQHYTFVVALKTNGTIQSWGQNWYGQCNIPNSIGAVSKISAGFSHTLAILTVEALQAAPNGATGSTAAEVRGVAARIATGLAVTLLESDLAERITSRLAEEAPFAEGWRSCPE